MASQDDDFDIYDREKLEEIEDDLIYKLNNNIEVEPVTMNMPKDDSVPTRRSKREQTKHQKYISRLEEATGANFEETVKNDLSPDQMQEALVQIQGEIRPNSKPVKMKYTIDEEGNKKRLTKKGST